MNELERTFALWFIIGLLIAGLILATLVFVIPSDQLPLALTASLLISLGLGKLIRQKYDANSNG